jgi:hypothetical protein
MTTLFYLTCFTPWFGVFFYLNNLIIAGLERLLFKKNLGFLGFLKKPKNPEKSKN